MNKLYYNKKKFFKIYSVINFQIYSTILLTSQILYMKQFI